MLLEQYQACLAANRELVRRLGEIEARAANDKLILKDFDGWLYKELDGEIHRWKVLTAAGWLVAAGLAVYVIFGG